MSDKDEDNVITLDIVNSTPTLNDLFQRLGETDVFNIVDSITYNTNSQTIVFHLQRLLETADDVQRHHTAEEDSADAKIIKLSETFKHKYPELLNYFKEWIPLREALSEILNRSSDNVERNFSFVSGIRIFTSAADIFGTLFQYNRQSGNFLANFFMENASVCGILALFIEMIFSKKIHASVIEAIKRDQDSFEKITQWFKQTHQLDATVRNFFPYGIDKDIVKQIHTSSDSFNDYQKMFMSIVASNVKQNVKLFKNKEFLDKADRFATSEAGKLWFHKVILENDPYFVHTLNSTLCDEIQCLLKISPTENKELYVDACRVLSSTVRMKTILNMITIISAGSNLWLGAKPVEANILRKLSKDIDAEREKIRNIVRLLCPSGLKVDPELRQ